MNIKKEPAASVAQASSQEKSLQTVYSKRRIVSRKIIVLSVSAVIMLIGFVALVWVLIQLKTVSPMSMGWYIRVLLTEILGGAQLCLGAFGIITVSELEQEKKQKGEGQ